MRWIIALSLITSGCTTLQKEAGALLSQKSYDEAISGYNKILQNDPSNLRARAKRKEAYKGWIGQKLIDVRLLRLSGNHSKSIEILHEIFENEQRWGVFPEGPAYSTQLEEIEYAQKTILNLVQKQLERKHPLKALSTLDRYKFFFQSKKAKHIYNVQAENIKLVGLIRCRSDFKKLANSDLFHARFLRSYCGLWTDKKIKISKFEKNYLNESFGSVSVNVDNARISKKGAEYLHRTLNKRLKDSPWYHSGSKKEIQLVASGKFNYYVNRDPIELSHSYTAQEYTAGAVVMDAVLVAAAIFALAHGSGWGRSLRGVGQKRNVQKTINFTGSEVTENFNINLLLQGDLVNRPISISVNNFDMNKSYEHDSRNSAVGLYPKQADYVNKENWLSEQIINIADEFEVKIRNRWDGLYCKTDFEVTDNIEHMMRCLVVADDSVPMIYEKWFRRRFGLESSQVYELLNDPDLSTTPLSDSVAVL